MKALILTPDRNSHGKHDYTGAFQPKAAQFAKHHDVPKEDIVKIDCSKRLVDRKKQVLEALGKRQNLDCVAFFCHGWPTGIQAGFAFPKKPKTRNQIVKPMGVLAKAIFEATDRIDIAVPLFCCSTASTKAKGTVGGDGGFADELRDALCKVGANECRVIGHTTRGHTTDNPSLRVFDGGGFPDGGTGGYWIVRPGGPLWPKWKKWVKKGGWKELPFKDLKEMRMDLIK